MSIYGAMYSGVSGLSAQSNAMGIISDNISNVNTVGYKGSTASFQTMVTQAATKTTYTPGGVGSRPLQGVDLQGLLQGTSNATDLAISGNGMFVVNESANPNVGDDMMFTRAGEFRPDENGDLRNAAGFYLQGWPIDDDGNLPAGQQAIGSVQTVNVSNLSGLPRPTSEISLGANLPSGQDSTAPTPHHVSTVQIFDSTGKAHNLEVQFDKTPNPNEWTATFVDPTDAATGATSGTITSGGSLTFTFNGNGSPTADITTNLEIDFDPTITGAEDMTGAGAGDPIAINLGTQDRFSGLTSFDSEFTGFTELNQNGLKFGNFTGTTVSEEGVVTAVFDNGRRKDIYQLPIAMFSNFNGLEERSGNAYLQTGESGDFLLTEAGTGGSGTVAPSALEQSTVDLAEEFTRMITTQRAYSASTKVITTSDEMLQELTQAVR